MCSSRQADRYRYSIVKTFFDRAPASQNEGSAAAPTNQPTTLEAEAHVRELSPPTVPTIPPTLILLLGLLEHSHSLLDLLKHSHSHTHITTAQRIQTGRER